MIMAQASNLMFARPVRAARAACGTNSQGIDFALRDNGAEAVLTEGAADDEAGAAPGYHGFMFRGWCSLLGVMMPFFALMHHHDVGARRPGAHVGEAQGRRAGVGGLAELE